MNFWTSPIDQPITGSEEDSFIKDFVIPDGTTAIAAIKSCLVRETEAKKYKAEDKYIEVVYKIVSEQYKNVEVTQKIKVFLGKPESVHRNLNMLKRLMTLCKFKPTHNNEPTNEDLAALCGKVIGITIAEWSMITDDGKMLNGNFVKEVHNSEGFECKEGVKIEVTQSAPPAESALSRNSRVSDSSLDDDIPF